MVALIVEGDPVQITFSSRFLPIAFKNYLEVTRKAQSRVVSVAK